MPGWSLIEKVARLGQDVRRGHELPVGLEEFLKPLIILIGELLDSFELLQEICIGSRDEPEQQEICVEYDLFVRLFHIRPELESPFRAP